MRRSAIAAAGAIALLLTGCGVGQSEYEEVRPLVSATQGDFTVVAYDDASVHAMLKRAADTILLVADGKPWNQVSNDDLNEEIIEVTFVDSTRSPNRYGGGTEATSTLITADEAYLAMSGEGGSCWGIHMVRDRDAAVIRYTSIFSPECTALEIMKDDVKWKRDWPERATPPEGFTPPEPPEDMNLPGGLTPGDVAPMPTPSPGDTSEAVPSANPSPR